MSPENILLFVMFGCLVLALPIVQMMLSLSAVVAKSIGFGAYGVTFGLLVLLFSANVGWGSEVGHGFENLIPMVFWSFVLMWPLALVPTIICFVWKRPRG